MGLSYKGALSPTGTIKSKNNLPPVWGTASNFGQTQGNKPFTANLSATDPEGSNLTFGIWDGGVLPAGLSISQNGIISGTPANVPGTYSFPLYVSDGTDVVYKTFNLEIQNTNPVWSTLAGSLGTINENTSFSYSLAATDFNNDNLTFSITAGNLPAGLSMSSSGVISGTTTQVNQNTTSNFTVQINDGATGIISRAFSITVNNNINEPPIWSTASGSLATLNENTDFSYNLSATDVDVDDTLTYSISTGALPPGLSLASNGVISGNTGVRFATATFNFIVGVSDGQNPVVYRSFSITVNDNINEAPTWTTAAGALGSFNVGETNTLTVVATDQNNETLTYSIVSGALPSGVSLNSSTGAISGTAAISGTYNFTIRVSDTRSETSDRAFTISVVDPVPSVTGTNVTIDNANKRIIFNYAGSSQTLSSTSGGSFTVRAWGAGGAFPSINGGGYNSVGGAGGFSKAVLSLTAATPYYVFVGGGGQRGTSTGIGGWPFGAAGGTMYAGYHSGGGGGGLSGIFSSNSPSRTNQLIIAGGGGGGGVDGTGYFGGAGGGSSGQTAAASYQGAQGTGGSQTANGGSGGGYGNGFPGTPSLSGQIGGPSGAGGGAGYCGGGGGGYYGGGGGGSGYVPAGGTTIAGNYATPPNQITAAGWYSGIGVGGNSSNGGNGLVVVSWGEVNPAWFTTSGALTVGTKNAAYTYTLSGGDLDGASVSYSIISGALPAGLTLNETTGVISGTPTNVAEIANFTARVTSTSGTNDRDFSIIISNQAPIWVTNATISFLTGGATNITLSATDPNGEAVTYSLVSGSLPSGISLNETTGVLSGSSAADGTYNFTIRATDTNGATTDRAFTGTSTSFSATGGTITYANGYKIHTFTNSGTITFSGSNNVEVLVVAGGGGGGGNGSSIFGGGGGAGGLLYSASYTVTSQAYTVTIGNGGTYDTNGENSTFGSFTAIGGGAGGTYSYHYNGNTGGSGGGSYGAYNAPGTAGQGYAGGTGTNAGSSAAGGGGGAGGAGGNGVSSSHGGYGGIGIQTSISGSPTWYAGGGGGAMQNAYGVGTGGSGVGGNGGVNGGNGSNGVANTGSGGGGGSYTSGVGGRGGSGIVIIRYPG